MPYNFTVIIFILKSLGAIPERNMPTCFKGLLLCSLKGSVVSLYIYTYYCCIFKNAIESKFLHFTQIKFSVDHSGPRAVTTYK